MTDVKSATSERVRGKPTGSAARAAEVPCPTCRRSTPWDGNPHRPFCSLPCRLIDLGAWLDERYRIHADERPDVSP
jgi:endogenous inhibitor of DNA gyrase (YacG/DUF329 family)